MNRRASRAVHAAIAALVVLSACSSGDAGTLESATSTAENTPTVPVTTDVVSPATMPYPTLPTSTMPVDTLPTTTPPTTTPPTTITPGDTTSLPDDAGAEDDWYLYAESGAKAVLAAMGGETGERPAGNDLEELLIEAAGAAYDLEYPVDVVYLDATVEYAGDEPIGVSVSVGDDEDDRRATAYVCLRAARAEITSKPCDD